MRAPVEDLYGPQLTQGLKSLLRLLPLFVDGPLRPYVLITTLSGFCPGAHQIVELYREYRCYRSPNDRAQDWGHHSPSFHGVLGCYYPEIFAKE